jgi:hypothetical protein
VSTPRTRFSGGTGIWGQCGSTNAWNTRMPSSRGSRL